jgi:two-component system sporulation sensor kinase A
MGSITSDENVATSVSSKISERKLVEEALRKSEEKYRSLVESSGFGIATIDFRGRFTLVNEALCRMIGYSEKELIGKSFAGFLHPEDKRRILPIFLNAWKHPDGKPQLEFRVIHKKGHTVHMYSAPTFCRCNGKIVGFSAIITDITKRKQMEEALRRSEERYRSIVELAPDAVIAVDLNGVITSVNAAFSRLSGYSKDEVIGKRFTELGALQAQNMPEYLRLFDLIVAGNPLPPTEFFFICKDGTERWGEAHIGFIESGGRAIGLQGVLRDITERKKAQQAILESQQKFERLFMGIPEAAVYWDSAFRVVDINPRFTELFGYSLDEIKSKASTGFIVPKELVEESNAWGEKAKHGYIDHDTVRMRKDGSLVPISMSVAPIVIEGQLTGYVGLYKDITERKKAEERIRESEEKYRSLFENARDVILTVDLEGNVISVNKAVEEYGWKREEIIGRSMLKLMSEESWPSLLKGMDQIAEGKPLEGEIELATPIGQRIAEYKSNPVIQGDKIVGVQVIGRDITERKLMETRLSELNSSGRELNSANSLDEVYALILNAMEKTLGFEYAEFNILNEDRFRVACQRGYDKAVCDLPLDGTKGGIIVRAARSRRAVLVSDVKKDPDYVEGVPGIQSELAIPVTADGEILGVLNVESGKLDAFGEKDATLLGILASHAATAISNLKKQSQIETALKRITESEEKHRHLFENAPDVIVTIDPKGKITSVNSAVQKYGYDRNELIGKSVFDLIPKEEWQGRQRNLRELAQGKSTKSEFKIKTMNESGYAIVESRSNPIIQDESVVGIQSIMTDVTERREMEEKLRDSEEKFRAINASASDAILLIDNQGKFSYWNPTAEKMFGYTKEEVDGKKMYELITPKRFRRDHVSAFERFKQTGEGRIIGKTVEMAAIRKDGTEFPVEFSLSALQVKGKQYALGIVRDITKRKKMEERLKQYSENLEELVEKKTKELLETERRYSILVEEASDGVAILQDGKIVFVNKKAPDIIGYSREEVIGLPFETFLDENYRQPAKEMCEQKLRGEAIPPTLEIEWISKTSEHVPVELSATLINYQGRPAILAIVRDISERKRIEEQRVRLEKLATIGELATMVAHDLRNPLTSIRNASFYIKNTCPYQGDTKCKTALEMIDIIEQETLFANNIINDLLDFSVKRPLNKESQNISKLVGNSLKQSDIAKNIEIEGRFAKKAVADIDEKQLERVFLNLIKNAAQAMPNGGKLAVATTETKENVTITFTDTGTGIAEENMNKIYTPLFTTKAKGIGMGLLICKRIIEEHGGTIDFKSKVGKGTTFTIKLPKNEGASDK